jgi:F420H(2)-dependent quinone reductase
MTNAYRPASDLVHEQAALYEATDGREGGTLEGLSVVIVTPNGVGPASQNFGPRPASARFP